jgi:hypothetical protein
MVLFAIIELEDGLSVAEIQPGQTAEEAASEQHGILVDAGPYATYEEAYDALCELEGEGDEE